MQSAPDDDYKLIFVYQDHLTKFVSLGALKTKTAKEVVDNIVSIFGTFGAPQILQTDNGREFANKLLEEAVAQWPGRKNPSRETAPFAVTKKCRTSKRGYRGYLERSSKRNKNYRRLLRKKLSDVSSDDDEIQQTSVYKEEEEEEKTLQEDNSTRYADLRPVSFMGSIESGVEKFPEFANQGNNDADFQLGIVGPVLGVQKDEGQAEIDCLHDSIMMERHGAHSAQKNQARKMLHASEQRFAPIDVGQNVFMPIPCIDRPKIGPRNLKGVATAVTDGFYSIGTQNVRLRQTFTRNQLTPYGAEFFSINSITDGETSLRTAVGAASISGSQGHTHCLCLSGCTTN
ncbi:unnamed protein product, partial [Mesorhabditis belari]|uniref:Integrase catalytic domain-containing protein n=1 Tax=Mesorhabditis belari TaxID=2138241 RepID=A0AAF3F0A5_9BILA